MLLWTDLLSLYPTLHLHLVLCPLLILYIDPHLYMSLQGLLTLQWSPFPIFIPQFFLPTPFPCPIMVVLLPWFLLFLLDLSLVVIRSWPRNCLRSWPRDNTYYTTRRQCPRPAAPCSSLSRNTVPFPLFSSWANPSSYHYSNDSMNLTFKPRTSPQALGGSPSNPLFKSNSSYPHIYSPMVTFNEPSENVRGMFSFVHSCQFSPGANNKLLLSSLIKR